MKTTRCSEQEKKLAEFFGKKYGHFLFSGTLALETALIAAKVGNNDYVLIPNYVCYRVLLSVIRIGAIPIIVSPKNNYILTVNDVAPIVKKYAIKAAILVHNLGLAIDIKSIKKILDYKTVIIEDASQAWDTESGGNKLGKYSDYVITSFGDSKPLNIGIGGAIFSDNQSFLKIIDCNTSKSRLSKKILLPYSLPKSFKINVKKLIEIGNKNVRHQRLIAKTLQLGLRKSKLNIWKEKKGDKSTWHRFPIWTEDKNEFNKLVYQADILGLKYEKLHKISLDQVPNAKKALIFGESNNKKHYHLLIKTRINFLKITKKWIKKIK